MLIRFKLENFKSFGKKQEIVMIPSKKIRNRDNHIINLESMQLLRLATFYGANASGKSNLIEAIRFSKYVIERKIPVESKKFYNRLYDMKANKSSMFEYEICLNNRFFAYGFNLNLHRGEIVSEWLYELNSEGNNQSMIFERVTMDEEIVIGEKFNLSEAEKIRFETYAHDSAGDKATLFLSEMNRNKKIDEDSNLNVFKLVFKWFEDILTTIKPNQKVTRFEYCYNDDGKSTIDDIISIFDTGISKVKVEKISVVDLKSKLPSELIDKVMEDVEEKIVELDEKTILNLSFRAEDIFFNIECSKNDELKITTIMMEHGVADINFEFEEESDGTRRLFDLLDILISKEKNKVYVVDELERSLHPKLTYRFVQLFINQLVDRNVQLIFTTHESTLMDQENLLRRDEIWFIERDQENISNIYSLDRFNERYDKKLDKAYLQGRYGAIPIFKEVPDDFGGVKCL